jgi:branched-chain amino acid transport system substrate-binding protein
MSSSSTGKRSAATLATFLILALGFQSWALPVRAETTPASDKPANDVIRIGWMASLTGSGKMPSEHLLEGAKFYLEQIKNKMAGKQVELIVENDESSPATGIMKFKKLTEQDKVDVINGVFFSHIAYAMLPHVEKAQVPVVIATAAGDDITQRKQSKWFIRTSYSSSQQTHALGDYAYKTLGYRRVATVGADIPYGYEQVGGFQQVFEGLGGKVVQKLWAPIGFTDFSELLKSVRKDVDAVFFCNSGHSSSIIPQQFRDVGNTVPMLGGTTSFDDSVLSKIGPSTHGAISGQPYVNTIESAANKKFVSAYRGKYNADPSNYSECGYISMMWIHKAVESLKGDVSDKNKLADALAKVQLKDSERGPMKLDSYNNPMENAYIAKVQKVGDKYVNVVVKVYPNISQFWPMDSQEYLKQPIYTKEYPPCKYCSEK